MCPRRFAACDTSSRGATVCPRRFAACVRTFFGMAGSDSVHVTHGWSWVWGQTCHPKSLLGPGLLQVLMFSAKRSQKCLWLEGGPAPSLRQNGSLARPCAASHQNVWPRKLPLRSKVCAGRNSVALGFGSLGLGTTQDLARQSHCHLAAELNGMSAACADAAGVCVKWHVA